MQKMLKVESAGHGIVERRDRQSIRHAEVDGVRLADLPGRSATVCGIFEPIADGR